MVLLKTRELFDQELWGTQNFVGLPETIWSWPTGPKWNLFETNPSIGEIWNINGVK